MNLNNLIVSTHELYNHLLTNRMTGLLLSPIDTAQPEDASPAPKDSFIYISSDDSSTESLFDKNGKKIC